MTTLEILKRAKAAKQPLLLLSDSDKNAALTAMADALIANADVILAANAAECEAAVGKIAPVMIDRLRLTPERIKGMADGIRDVVALPSPLGRILAEHTCPNGLEITRVSVPIGVVGIIYESRPNVTSDAAALCFKSGNVCVLKSGKEAGATSAEIVRILREAVAPFGVEDAINILEDNSRAGAAELMNATDYVDALIPRGGAGLIRHCVENAKVPCIQTGTGICHIYVDAAANVDMALDIVENAKTSRPSVCNAAEVCLVHSKIAPEFLPRLAERLVASRAANGLAPVELRVHSSAAAYIDGVAATETDFDTEFLDYVMAVRTVDSLDEAIAHIGEHSTHHSDAIVTADADAAESFLNRIDSAAVYVNASTRFTDGGEFGLGCEIGISTQKLHARGPMGLCELTSYKYTVRGKGQIR